MDTSAPREWIARLLLRTLTAVSVTSKNEAAAIAIYEKQKLRQGVRGGRSLEIRMRGGERGTSGVLAWLATYVLRRSV